VKALQPNAVRLLLTGYSDLAAVVGSINDGEVFRFVRKPWDNAEIQRTIADAVAIGMELSTLDPARAAPPPTHAAVLVVDPANDLAQGLGQLLPAARVRRVADADAALKALDGEEIGVIIADLAAGKDLLVTMLKLLKAEHPEIVTILVTESADADLAIELINQAQVFRLLEKPLDTRSVHRAVTEALAKYASLRATPDLVRQHKVAAGNVSLTDWGSRMLQTIRSLPRRILSRAT
jgi:eukaryotic-like serine/threonine-protein kinase